MTDYTPTSEVEAEEMDAEAIENFTSPAHVPSAGTLIPVTTMDEDTKQRLEALRPRVPRYLFRAWKASSYQHTSIGQIGLNGSPPLVPSAFRHGRGHANIYDMSAADFRNMVSNHFREAQEAYCTELSSWTASLSCAITYAKEVLGGDRVDCHISIIDTRELWPYNQIFFAPDLSFLGTDLDQYDCVYLAHGVIRGPYHRASSLGCFHIEKPGDFDLYLKSKLHESYERRRIRNVAKELVEGTEKISESYGLNFVLPMGLALICLVKRRSTLFDQDGEELKVVFKHLADLHYPYGWIDDSTIMTDLLLAENEVGAKYPDVRQFVLLMRAVALHYQNDARDRASQATQKPALRVDANRKASRKTITIDEGKNEYSYPSSMPPPRRSKRTRTGPDAPYDSGDDSQGQKEEKHAPRKSPRLRLRSNSTGEDKEMDEDDTLNPANGDEAGTEEEDIVMEDA